MVSPSRSASSSPEPSNTMQLFIKPITGDTITLTVPSTITTEKLTTLLSIRTRLPTSSLRLIHAGHHLSPSDILAARGIRSESTLHLASPVRGGMPPKKIRCGARDGGLQCKEGVSRIVGECGFCGGCFCGKHRLLEDHKCAGLEDVSCHPAFASFSAPGTPFEEVERQFGEEQAREADLGGLRRDGGRLKEDGKGKGLAGGLSPKELGVVVNHDGSVESVMRLAGVQEGKPREKREYAE